MNLYEFVKDVLKTAKRHRLVNRVEQGDVYQIMNSGKQVYSSVVLTINTVTKNLDLDTYTVSGELFYIDRCTDNNDNVLQVQSTAVEVLDQIMIKLTEEYNWNLDSVMNTPFTEKFGDLCAGCYATFAISLPLESVCVDDEMYR